MESCTIITCKNCEFYNTQYCKDCSKEGDDCYEHWEWRHDVSWRQEQINNLTQKISDLEAKLAESEERISWLVEAEWNRKWANRYIEMRRKEDPKLLFPDSDEVYERYFELKQQLAEKELDIIRWKEHFYNAKMDYECLKEELEKKDDEILKGDCAFMQEVYNSEQDKISFALEQLEKVKEIINTYNKEHCFLSTEIDTCNKLVEIIDNQIKAIKGYEVV